MKSARLPVTDCGDRVTRSCRHHQRFLRPPRISVTRHRGIGVLFCLEALDDFHLRHAQGGSATGSRQTPPADPSEQSLRISL
jgi:hypothetical protein